MRQVTLPLLILALVALSAGCGNGVAFQPRLTEKSVLVVDQWVQTSPLVVMVRPKRNTMREYSALFIPFRVEQNISDVRHHGRELMRIFWTDWTSKSVFPTMVYDDTLYYRSPEEAVRLARQKGANLAVTGVVTYLLHGGTQADTAVSLRLEVYDTATGYLVWSMEQAGRMEANTVEDYIFFARKTRLPMDPMYAVLTNISDEMAQPVLQWNGLAPRS